MTALCRSCGAAVIWCQTESGKMTPIDAVASEGGNVVIRPAFDASEAPIAHVLTAPELARPALEARHMPHFATCPNAAKHRRRAQKVRGER